MKNQNKAYESEKRYAAEKKKLMAAGLDPAVYERRVKQLAKKHRR